MYNYCTILRDSSWLWLNLKKTCCSRSVYSDRGHKSGWEKQWMKTCFLLVWADFSWNTNIESVSHISGSCWRIFNWDKCRFSWVLWKLNILGYVLDLAFLLKREEYLLPSETKTSQLMSVIRCRHCSVMTLRLWSEKLKSKVFLTQPKYTFLHVCTCDSHFGTFPRSSFMKFKLLCRQLFPLLSWTCLEKIK